MADALNDRDILLLATTIRLEKVPSNFISLEASSPYFNVVNGAADPTSIIVTAKLNGQLLSLPTLSVISGLSTVTEGTDASGNRTATVAYGNLTADTAIIRASLNYLGVTYTADISIAGQVTKPATPTGLTFTALNTEVKLTWNKNIDADIAGYEVRTSNTNWGNDNSYVFRGSTNSCVVTPGTVGSSTIWYLKAFDTNGLYSTNAAVSSTFTYSSPPNVVDIIYEYADTSLTNATITLNWPAVSPAFGLKEYRLTYFSEHLQSNTTITLRDNLVVLPADWVGNKTFTVVTVDNHNSLSSGYSEVIPKNLPNPLLNFKASAIDNIVQLTWILPTKTSLPISHALIKKGIPGGTWNTATEVGIKSGNFTTVQEQIKGNYVYWGAAVDTDGNESTPVQVPVFVQQPPDFIFNREFTSTFSGSKTNAVVESGTLVLPANATETWQQHFVNNAWANANAQITAKYPIYVQPGTATATYQETFDYGNGASLILGSSSITVAIAGQDIIGTTSLGVTISTSADGVTYSTPVAGFATFAFNFRFIRVTINATRGTGDAVTNIGSVYKLTNLVVRLDTKLKTDSGNVEAIATNVDGGGGTIVNFPSEFIDISSITLTASGTVPRTCVYSFTDGIYTGTYSIVSNVLTATISSVNIGGVNTAVTDHGMYPTQRVRLSTSNGAIPAAAYTVASRPNATSFTATVSAPNSSGTIFMYPNSMRVYVFDNNGIRQSQTVSWIVRGS
jgi:hypothetical protein